MARVHHTCYRHSGTVSGAVAVAVVAIVARAIVCGQEELSARTAELAAVRRELEVAQTHTGNVAELSHAVREGTASQRVK